MKKTTIGGQALIEGLMMIGPENAAIAVRKLDGEIVIDKRPLPAKLAITKVPVVRGVVNFFRQFVMGFKALMFSASFFEIEEEDQDEGPSKFDLFLKKVLGEKRYQKLEDYFEKKMGNTVPDFMIYISVVIAILFSVGLFMLFPNFVAELLGFKKDKAGTIFYNLFEGFFKMFLFFLYIYVVSYMKEIYRVWQYHGAEHKAIHCYESGLELTVENVRKFTTKHPRCGTSFMIIVIVVSILLFALLPRSTVIMNVLYRLSLVPLIAGLSYEILKFAGKHTDHPIMKAVNAPGLWFQRFTTREPDDSQIEVAIVAMKNVMVEDNSDQW